MAIRVRDAAATTPAEEIESQQTPVEETSDGPFFNRAEIPPAAQGGYTQSTRPPADLTGDTRSVDSLRGQTNAHRTNTEKEFENAANSEPPFDWFEADLRLTHQNGKPVVVCRHNPWDSDGMTFREWLEKVRTVQPKPPKLKLDIKEPEHLEEMLALLKTLGPKNAEDIMFNLSFSHCEKYQEVLKRDFPNSILALNAPSGELDAQKIEDMKQQSARWSGPVTFVAEYNQINQKPETIASLQQVAPLSVWNDASAHKMRDAEATRDDLMQQGVLGVIALDNSSGPVKFAVTHSFRRLAGTIA